GMTINISVPSLTVDMLGAIMSVPAIEFAAVSDKVLFIDETFIIGEDTIQSNMILIPEMDSLAVLLQRLGVDI
ncbi:MAG TPA: chemotaxis protein CheC, partial [Oscillospiraceae bacterium]|nr:chemotaxis protein CheC [Oscillospiraceae bacterium]